MLAVIGAALGWLIPEPMYTSTGSIRIVPVLQVGAGVVTSRAHVHYVVTEHGVAYLHGRSIRERAQALIAIADPAFREELTRYARERLGV